MASSSSSSSNPPPLISSSLLSSVAQSSSSFSSSPDTTFAHASASFSVVSVLASTRLSAPVPAKTLRERGLRFDETLAREHRVGIPGRPNVSLTHYGPSHPARVLALGKRRCAFVYPTGLVVVQGRRCGEACARQGVRAACEVVQRVVGAVLTHPEPAVDSLVVVAAAALPAVPRALDADLLWFERTAALHPDVVLYEPELLHALVVRVPPSHHLLPPGSSVGAHAHAAAAGAAAAGDAGGHGGSAPSSSSSSSSAAAPRHSNPPAVVVLLPDGRVVLHGVASRVGAVLAYEWVRAKIVDRDNERAAQILSKGWAAVGTAEGAAALLAGGLEDKGKGGKDAASDEEEEGDEEEEDGSGGDGAGDDGEEDDEEEEDEEDDDEDDEQDDEEGDGGRGRKRTRL
jgi:TATA-box binding protein (TBP) (component of TFIID and TFIIIB)